VRRYDLIFFFLLSLSVPFYRYLWIRIALYERKLSKIIDHLVSNAHRYYDKDSLVADSDYGSILSSLLVGPCALEYSKAKSQDCFWNDPTANDLVQRHIISTPNSQMTPTPSRRPMLNIKRTHNSSDDSGIGSYNKSNSPASTAKDYVESLHQNSRATLLYGKNNVHVHHVSFHFIQKLYYFLMIYKYKHHIYFIIYFLNYVTFFLNQ
jgi:small G protein signaling modulator 1